MAARFPTETEAALDLLALADLAWHDTYADLELPAEVLDDLLIVAKDLPELVGAVTLALTDWRDLRVGADALRQSPQT